MIAFVLGINYNKFYRWYKEVFSEFRTFKEQQKLHQHDIDGGITNEGKHYKIRVPIFKPEHIGKHMAIDDKHLGGIFYTVLTNAESSRVALMIASVDPKKIAEALLKFSDRLSGVETISRDLSTTYRYIASRFFPNATQIADKYHVIAKSIESVQDIRIRLKQKAQKDIRLEEQKHKKQYLEYIKNKKQNPDGFYPRIKKGYLPKRLRNGETAPELLSRSKHLLYKYPKQWTVSQKKRATILFKEYPEIKEAFELKIMFRDWYKPRAEKDKTWNFLNAETDLLNWIYTAEQSLSNEIRNFVHTVENNFKYILNYHQDYRTNAIAESINAKIKRATRNNNGTRDLDFFHFRLNLIL